MRRIFLILFLFASTSWGSPLPDFRPTGDFAEQLKWEKNADGVRIYFNAPENFDAHRATQLIIYLLPNGNTIEQTLGKKLVPGIDWHFDIQHIAAHVRFLRQLDTNQNIVLCCLEAPGLSWPKFRADHPDNPAKIRSLVDSVSNEITAELHSAHPATRAATPIAGLHVALVAHSGGGSFIIGYLNSGTIEDQINRIVFLDANYSYSDDLHHGDKLLDWLRRPATPSPGTPGEHRGQGQSEIQNPKSKIENDQPMLLVFAYDDRNITLNGKKIVSDTGGTWRASQRMMARFTKEQSPRSDTAGPFQHYSFLDGQAQFYLHPNPQQKILHTAMIGEMNVFLEAMTLGTPQENKYGTLGGPRAYTDWVAPATLLDLPVRTKDAPTGSAFLKQIETLPTTDREDLVIREILAGNVPNFLRNLKPVRVSAQGETGAVHTGVYYVTPDVLAIGSDDDFFRMPLTPVSVEKIADAIGCSMITRKVSDDIYNAAQVKLAPVPLTQKRESPDTFYQSNQIIESQRKGKELGLLVAGIKKDVVLTNRLNGRDGHVAIYGWHKLDGKPIQPLYVGHLEWYVDYSHGIRLMSDEMIVDGKKMKVRDVLAAPELCALLSDEGPIIPAHYSPATHPATTQPSTQK